MIVYYEKSILYVLLLFVKKFKWESTTRVTGPEFIMFPKFGPLLMYHHSEGFKILVFEIVIKNHV
jgi:hypothetical protein